MMPSSLRQRDSAAESSHLNCDHLYGWNGFGRRDPAAVAKASMPVTPMSTESVSAPHSGAELPRISIVVPTRNQAATIADTIVSILGQNYPHCEIIVVDGGSEDDTLNVLDRYRSELALLISEPDRGQSDAINKGFAQASGDLLCWLNSDDYLLPGALWRVAAAFRADPDLELLVGCGDVISFDHQFLRHIPALELNEHTLLNWKNDRWIMQQCCFWTHALWRRVGGVDERLHLLMDYDLWFRFGRATRTALLGEKLAVMRYYPDAKTVREKANVYREYAYVYAKNGCLDALDQHIASLLAERTQTHRYLERIDASLPVRLLKRLSLFPSPA